MLKFRNKSSLLLIIFMLIGTMVFTACTAETDLPDEPSVQGEDQSGTVEGETEKEAIWTITVETPEDESIDFTNSDLNQIGKIDIKATTKRKDGTEEENEWTGVQLKEVLQFVNIEDFELVEIEAKDGFSVEYTKEIVNSDGTVLAVEKDGEPLDEKSGPVQMVVEGEGAKLWIKNVAKIKASN